MTAKLSDISNRAVREQIGSYMAGGTPVLAINAGAAATVKTTQSPAASLYSCINGVPKLLANKAAGVLTAVAALQNPITGQDTFYVQPANTTVYYVLVTDGSGDGGATVAKCIQGTYAGQTFTPFKNVLGSGDMPDISVPNTWAPYGYIKVVTGATTFTPATDALDKASVTFTFGDLHRMPATNL